MSSIKSSLENISSYHNFDVLSVSHVKDCDSTAVYLRHRKTGLEVFHLLNDDEENLFAFAFRTPPEDSCGTPHIIEHSVFCGSERYPLKDPFVTLMNQSVNTFMNAMTYPDRTVFPASSMVRTDYFNLMSVYGDAVFFPRLDKKVFMQEGFRLEVDKKDKYSLQGVVYNEMKGEYSSFENVASDAAFRSLLTGSVYELDSGGDPVLIPSLTYEKYRAFHEKYYRPDNCLVFLYGNIPTEQQLDFLQSEFLDRLENKFSVHPICSLSPVVCPDIISGENVPPLIAPVSIHTTGPASGNAEKDSTVTVNWLLGNSNDLTLRMEWEIISEVLVGHDGAPLVKALLNSHLGDDIAGNTGLLSEIHQMQFTAGLRGVKAENADKVESLIFSVLTDLCKEGIAAQNIDSALMSVDFDIREVTRSSGPYSLRLLNRVLMGWIYGTSPVHMLDYTDAFAAVSNRIASDPRYLEKRIMTLLLENSSRSLVVVEPNRVYSEQRETREKETIKELTKGISPDDIRQQMSEMHAFQTHKETKRETECIPHIHPSDLSVNIDEIRTEITTCEGCNGSSLYVFANKESTNGIVYIDVGFPADVLEPEDYPYIPLYAIVSTNMGWAGMDWAETSEKVALCCGGFGSSSYSSSVPDPYMKNNGGLCADYLGRDWIFFHMKMLTEKTEEAFDVLADCIAHTEFSDVKRLEDLLKEYRNNIDSAVIPSGHSFAIRRASRFSSRSKAVSEIWRGISQLYSVHGFSDSDKTELLQHFASLDRKLKAGGSIIHITADEVGMETVRSHICEFTHKAGLCSLSPRIRVSDERFYALTRIGEEDIAADNESELFVVPSQIGFCAESCKAAPYGTKESASDIVAAHWLSGSSLWEKIRTIGGAYGAFAATDAVEKLFILATYRDPRPLKSRIAFLTCLQQAANKKLSATDVERAVTGTYGNEVQPRSASGRGYAGFMRSLYGITTDDIEQKLSWVLSVTAEDICNSCKRFLSEQDNAISVVINGHARKSEGFSGKIIHLPL